MQFFAMEWRAGLYGGIVVCALALQGKDLKNKDMLPGKFFFSPATLAAVVQR